MWRVNYAIAIQDQIEIQGAWRAKAGPFSTSRVLDGEQVFQKFVSCQIRRPYGHGVEIGRLRPGDFDGLSLVNG
jgi:hypothetical protein